MNSFNHDDIMKVAPTPNEQDTPQRVSEKKPNLFKRVMLSIIGFIVALIFIVVALLVYHINNGGMTKKTVEDLRSCLIEFENRELTGTRVYMYQYREIFGWRFYNSENVVEKTSISIKGEPLSIIGINKEEESWALHIKQGEFYNQLIIPAERYVFLLGGDRKTVITTYKEICK